MFVVYFNALMDLVARQQVTWRIGESVVQRSHVCADKQTMLLLVCSSSGQLQQPVIWDLLKGLHQAGVAGDD